VFGRRKRHSPGRDEAADATVLPDESVESVGSRGFGAVAADSQTDSGGQPARPAGPWDVSEVDEDDGTSGAGRIDLGGLRVRGVPGMQLQVQVEQESQRVTSILVVLGDAAVQLLAVAAPRNESMWPQTRAQITADAGRRGGSAEEAEGPFGTELRVLVPVDMPDGGKGVQPSRMVGIDGPRWLLRATFLGQAAVDDAAFEGLAQVVRDVVVVRGSQPMPPGDLIPFTLPQQQPAPADDSADGAKPTLDDLDPGPTITEIR